LTLVLLGAVGPLAETQTEPVDSLGGAPFFQLVAPEPDSQALHRTANHSDDSE
jgi:hypothetical protein